MPSFTWILFNVAIALTPQSAIAETFPKADQELKQVDTYIQQKIDEFAKAPGDISSKIWVKAKIAHMVEIDQFLRKYFESPLRTPHKPLEESYLRSQIAKRSAKFDRDHANDLKTLIAKHGWTKVSEFGDQTDRDAWLIVQHADHDPRFQRDVLAILETLYAQKETSASNYAYLFDRVASSFSDPSKRKPQRYGTQGKCTGPGTWEPHPVEDPANLDKRRASVGLPPEAEYLKMFKDICRQRD